MNELLFFRFSIDGRDNNSGLAIGWSCGGWFTGFRASPGNGTLLLQIALGTIGSGASVLALAHCSGHVENDSAGQRDGSNGANRSVEEQRWLALARWYGAPLAVQGIHELSKATGGRQ